MSVKSSISGYKWYPVCTQPRAEKKAHQALTAKGINSYLPLRRQLKQWSDRKKWVEEPLLKSYLFVYISENEQTEVLMTKGITRFIYFSGKVTSMSDRQLEDLKLLTESGYTLDITSENLEIGEKTIIKAGPLKGMIGEVIAYMSQKTLILRLENLGCSIIVNIAANLIDRF